MIQAYYNLADYNNYASVIKQILLRKLYNPVVRVINNVGKMGSMSIVWA